MPPAVVIGLCSHGLATARSLARYGVIVHALECDSSLPGFRTRIAKVHWVPEIHGQGLIAALRSLVETLETDSKPVLYPINDKMVECIANHWHELENSYQLSWGGCRDRILGLLHKEALEKHCAQRGLPYPLSHLIGSLADAEELATRCIFPQIVKPSRPLGTFKTQIANCSEQLLGFAKRYHVDYPILAQPFIDGDDSHLYFCGLYLDQGRVIARFDGHKLDRKSTRLNSSHTDISRMPSSA